MKASPVTSGPLKDRFEISPKINHLLNIRLGCQAYLTPAAGRLGFHLASPIRPATRKQCGEPEWGIRALFRAEKWALSVRGCQVVLHPSQVCQHVVPVLIMVRHLSRELHT